jgi:hypothetical protein
MDENVGKSPDRVENAEWQSRLKLDVKGVSDDFALAPDGQAMVAALSPAQLVMNATARSSKLSGEPTRPSATAIGTSLEFVT